MTMRRASSNQSNTQSLTRSKKAKKTSSVAAPTKPSRGGCVSSGSTAVSTTVVNSTNSSNIINSSNTHPCKSILILDSGGWTIKHGILCATSGKSASSSTSSLSSSPRRVPNAVAKLKHQLAILVADEIDMTVKNKSQLDITRPYERGYCTNLHCLNQVWTRVMELNGIYTTTTAAAAAAITITKTSHHKTNNTNIDSIPSLQVCCLLLTQPFTPTVIQDAIDQSIFMDLGFGKCIKLLLPCMAAYRYLHFNNNTNNTDTSSNDDPTTVTTTNINYDAPYSIDKTQCCCVVDSGFSFTHVVPTVNNKAVEKAIRRINVGGKILTNHLKELISYRQWNMMDEFAIVNEAKEKTCFVSTNFVKDLSNEAAARHFRNTTTTNHVDFILPDFVTTFEGNVVRSQHHQQQQQQDNHDEYNSLIIDATDAIDDDDDGATNDAHQQQPIHQDSITMHDIEEEDDEDEIDEDTEENEEERSRRIQKQKQEEQRRKEMEEQERQVLSLSTERFSVPEVLFSPSYIGLHNQCGIVDAIYQSIESCPPYLRAAMYQNILLVGGNANLFHIRERIEIDLRKLSSYKIVRVVSPTPKTTAATINNTNNNNNDNPIDYAWKGAAQFISSSLTSSTSEEDLYSNFSVDKTTWERHVKNNNGSYELWVEIQNRLLHDEDSILETVVK